MPLVFIHGVNTRNFDADYFRSVAARKTMFEQLVVPSLRAKYPKFQVADDIYWGDLGVDFSWSLRSIPEMEKAEQSQGASPEASENLDLAMLLAAPQPDEPEQRMGADRPLVEAAQRDPAGLVRSIFAPESDIFVPTTVDKPSKELTQKDKISAEAQGQHLRFLLIAVERFATKAAKDPALIQAATDQAVLKKIQDGVDNEYQDLVRPWVDDQAGHAEEQAQGALSDGFAWVGRHLGDLIAKTRTIAKSAAAQAGSMVSSAERAASLTVMKSYRDSITRKGLRFIGDVFVYLQHGRTGNENIYARVKTKLLALAASAPEGEPFIVVTHSFGSEILYDLLTTGALDDLSIHLWVTVGAQTSLFAEMKLYSGMPENIPQDTSKFILGKPANVVTWINIYDKADALSYLHKPVFGDVEDIPIEAQGNLKNAHGHYFVTPVFYDLIAKELIPKAVSAEAADRHQ
jgi:hypothetical protein